MNSRSSYHLQILLAAIDLLSINAVFFIAEFLFRKQFLIQLVVEYSYFGIFLSIAWLTVALIGNIYHAKYILSFEIFTKRSMRAFVYFVGLVIFYLFFFQQFILSRAFIIAVLCSISVSLLINRFFYFAIYHYFKKRLYLISKVVVIGYNNLSKKLVNYLQEDGMKKEILGFCEEYENIKELSNYPILSNVSDAANICKQNGVTEIYSTIAPEHNPSIYQLIKMADQNCIRFKIVPDISFFVKRHVHIDNLNEMLIISLRNEPLEDLGNRIRKRLFDIVVSLLVIIFILSWLIPIISLLIWIKSKGPIFFIQERSGRDNKSFPCIKFRSMKVNAMANEQQATKSDSRITPIGRFLRRTSIDELPQFFNVLRGYMSIVGPRPHMLKHTDDYSRLIDRYMIRQFLKPGITGWAQVNGFRGETQTLEQMQKRVDHDLWYMENWSLWLDLKIIVMTVFNTMRREKNAF